jgi:dihydrofolate synthase / folylpolyglutamate synthase
LNDREWLARLEFFGIKLGLDSITAILDELDRPHRAFPVIHIGGTNGKGSVVAMVSHALTTAGLRTGRYTSPHLVNLEERFAIDGVAVTPDRFDAALARVRAAVARLTDRGILAAEPTYFEVTTAVAFDIFRNIPVDVAVIEVGLGGRLDATNVVVPAMTAITSVDFDHEAQLGSSMAAIAAEKAGIIKPGVPVVVGSLKREAFDTIQTIAMGKGASLVSADCADTEVRSTGAGRFELIVRTNSRTYGPIVLGLRGRHQIENAVVAVLLLDRLPQSLAVDRGAVEAGLRDVRWPGRLDLVAIGARSVLIDGAHNPAGAKALASYLSEAYASGVPIVFGVMSDKRARDMLAELVPVARTLVLTRAPGTRAADPIALASLVDQAGSAVVIQPAIDRALSAAWAVSDSIAVAGSLYLAGEIYRQLDVRIA